MIQWANIKFEPQPAADGTALATCTTGATPTLEATGVIADNKVKQNVTVKGNYFIGGTANTKLKLKYLHLKLSLYHRLPTLHSYSIKKTLW